MLSSWGLGFSATAIQASGTPYLIFRTSWIYGVRGSNFLLTMLRLAKERGRLKIVDDQFGAPTWARMVAEATAQVLAQIGSQRLLPQEVSGVYHLTSGGKTSWHGFAEAIFKCRADLNGGTASPQLIPIPASEYPLPAPRPHNSVMSNAKLQARFGLALPDWKSGLQLCIQESAR